MIKFRCYHSLAVYIHVHMSTHLEVGVVVSSVLEVDSACCSETKRHCTKENTLFSERTLRITQLDRERERGICICV